MNLNKLFAMFLEIGAGEIERKVFVMISQFIVLN